MEASQPAGPAGHLDETAYLRDAELFQGLDPATLAAIAQAARRRAVRAGGYLFRQGDPADRLYVLTRGSVKLTQSNPEGDQVLLRVVGVGETFGANAPLGNMRYPATAQAVPAGAVLVWDGPTMLRLMEAYPHLAINTVRVLAARVHEFQDRYRELATERVERRVARALLRLAGQAGHRVAGGVLIDMAFSRQDLAEMTGTKRFSISRIFSDWESRGIIQAGRERVLIRQPPALVRIAEDLPPAMPVPDIVLPSSTP